MSIPQSKITDYQDHLIHENRTSASMKEHIRYANRFVKFLGERELCEGVLKEYRKHIDEYYSTYNGKNSCVSYVNSLLRFLGKNELQIAYFEANRIAVKIKTPPLTEDEITKILYYADNYERVNVN